MTDKDNHKTQSALSRLFQPLYALLLINFTGALGFSIVMPFLVFLVHKWGGNALMFAMVSAAYSVFQLIGAPILGRWSDQFGRRRILLMSQLGSAVSWTVMLAAFYIPAGTILDIDSALLGKFSLTLPLIFMFFARALDGLTGGSDSVANAYLADITPEGERKEKFGKLAASANLGYIVGPALAGVLGGTILGYELPVIFALGISLLAAFLIVKGLPKADPKPLSIDPQAANAHKVMGQEHRACVQTQAPVDLSSIDLVRLPNVAVILIIYFLVMLAFNFFYVAFPVQAATSMHWSVSHTGSFFAFMSLFMVITQGPILSRFSKVWSERRLVVVGSLLLGCGFLTLVPAIGWLAFVGAFLIALGNGLMWASVVALLSKAAGTHQGAVQGLAGSIGAGASVLGLLLGGLTYNYLGGWLFVMSSGLIFAVVFLSLCLSPEKIVEATDI